MFDWRVEAIDEEALKPLRRGCYLGSERFKEQMLDLMEGKLGESHSGELHRETAEQRATRIIAEEFARRGWQEFEWAIRRRSDLCCGPSLPGCGAKRPC